MDFLKDRRVIVAGGAAVVALLAIVIGLAILRHDKPATEPPPASQVGLVIDTSQAEIKRDPNRQYRCFKDGQFAAMATLDDCARMNGVLSGALDVGVDETGALAAAQQLGTTLTPLPPPPVAMVSPVTTAPSSPAPAATPPPPAVLAPESPIIQTRAPAAGCQRYDRGWANVGEMSLNACIQTLFAGRCERAGQAAYGRWGDQTLRLVPGRVEQSRDDRSFHDLVEQGPGCAIPSL